MNLTKKPPLFIITGASGVGKTALFNELILQGKQNPYIFMDPFANLRLGKIVL